MPAASAPTSALPTSLANANVVITNGLGGPSVQQVASTTSGTSPTTATATMPTANVVLPTAAAIIGTQALPTQVTQAVLPAVAPTVIPANHSTQKDTTWTKLFVGGLPYHTTDKSLRDHFECYGDIEEAVVITDRQTGKSRGYGFVIMATKEAAERACKEPNPIIDGRKANVNLAILGAKPRLNSLQAGLPLTALRQSFHALLPAAAAAGGQYGDLNSVMAAVPVAAAAANPNPALNPVAAAAAAAHAAQAASVTSQASAYIAAGGKAKSSLSLPSISGRLAPAAASAASANPYLQSMYAAMAGQASNPYAQLQGTGLISLAQAQNQLISQAATPAQAGTTGNPLLDAYGQYAAQLAAAQQVYTTTANQQQLTASSAIDAQANGMSAYLTAAGGYYQPVMTAQQLAGLGAQAGHPGLAAYAAAAPPTVSQAATAGAEARLQ